MQLYIIMEIFRPKDGEITVYSKSGCPGCNNVKKPFNRSEKAS